MKSRRLRRFSGSARGVLQSQYHRIFNTEAAYGTSEELWFPEWEFKGPP